MRKYLIGIDGGGTKTIGVLADSGGTVLCSASTAGTNCQIIGMDEASAKIAVLVDSLLVQGGITGSDVAFLLLGLAGVDLPEDVAMWEAHLAPELAAIPHSICTDTWVAFAAGTPRREGAISVCGTGHNTAVRRANGEAFVISALRFPLGNFGGGRMITDIAMHAAFRDYESVGEHTLLTAMLPAFCDTDSMDSLRKAVLCSGYAYQYGYPVPRLVAELAEQGDAICRGILWNVGSVQGEMTARLILKAGLEKSELPIVMAGSVYCGEAHGDVTQAFREKVSRFCPALKATYILLEHPPVLGAVTLAAQKAFPGMDDNSLDGILKQLLTTFKGAAGK